MNLAIPKLKEGLSGSLDQRKIPDKIINTLHEKTTRHDIEGPCEVRKEKGKIIITIPQNQKTKADITITSSYSINGYLDLDIIAEAGSKATLHRTIKETIEHEQSGIIREQITIHVRENATIHYNEEQYLSTHTSWHTQKKASVAGTLNWYHHTAGGNLSIQEIKTVLMQEKAHTTLLCTTSITGEQEHYSSAHIEHETPGSTSTMHAKTVIGGKAKTLHKGLITIHKEATKATGYQQEDIIITSKEAEANVLPELDINNPDVSCSHGASIGDIDETQLFYLQSRGLNEETARTLITTGFLKSIANNAQDAQWKQKIISILERGEQE